MTNLRFSTAQQLVDAFPVLRHELGPRFGPPAWRDAAEFLLLGATSVQVCTAAMHYGYRIVEDMIDGLVSRYPDEAARLIQQAQAQAA